MEKKKSEINGIILGIGEIPFLIIKGGRKNKDLIFILLLPGVIGKEIGES